MNKNEQEHEHGTGTRPEKVLTKNNCQVRDLEDRILCPRAMAMFAFFAITFFPT